MKRDCDLASERITATNVETSLACCELEPLPIFTNASDLERYVDSVATKLGLPVRAEACWIGPTVRKLTYQDTNGSLEMSVHISLYRSLESRPAWSVTPTFTRRKDRLSIRCRSRLRPASFEKDARETLAKMRTLKRPKAE